MIKKIIKKLIIMIKKIIKKLINKFGYDIKKRVSLQYYNKDIAINNLNFQHFLMLYFSKILMEKFFFIQIGANDGKTADHIYKFVLKYDLPGILIEPQEDAFKKLEDNYRAASNLIFANVAISDKDSCRNLFVVKESYKTIFDKNSKYGASGKASFFKEHIKKNIRNKFMNEFFFKEQDINNYIDKKMVKTLSFKTLINKYNVKKFDLLMVDVEGYDFEIIKQIDFNKFQPSLINYESKNLKVEDQVKCIKILKEKGYLLFNHGSDTCAFKI